MGLAKLSDEQIQTALQDLEGWSVVEGKLHKEFQFSDFNEAFGFMARASMHIEKMNHHPDAHSSILQLNGQLHHKS